MRKSRKILIIIIVAILVLLGLLWGGWTWFSRQAFPKVSGKISISGLNYPVEILRDSFGVAHIYAQTSDDLFFAQGFVHAQERFWQMEFQRRLAAGRLSEIFGEATLGTDRYLRQFGFYGLSEASYDLLDEETRKVIHAYTAGVNAYIKDRKPSQLGLEFALLELQGIDMTIEEWTVVDTMSWAEMMIFDQSDQMTTEMANIDRLAAVGWEMYRDLNPPYREDRPVIIQSDEWEGSAVDNLFAAEYLQKGDLQFLSGLFKKNAMTSDYPELLTQLGFRKAAASNSFVVSGELTADGVPLLANDPHMGVNMPALWYEVGLHCAAKSKDCIYNLRGFSLPGVPGILIGHNDRIAWGLTNASFDAEDVFIERLNPENPNQYEVNGDWVDMDMRREEIVVRGWKEPEVIFVRKTRNGVVASDTMLDQNQFSHDGESPELFALTYAWTALEPVQSLRAVMLVNRAQNWEEFVNGLQYFEAGKQNWLFADVDGNIGYVMPGKVPIRAGGDGSLPVPGWNEDYRWTGFIPYQEAPILFNPDKGFIVTANNPQLHAEDYPYLIGTDQDRGQRAQRITSMISDDPDGITIDDMMAIQTDNQDVPALEVIPYLADLTWQDPEVSAARDRLLDWDGQMNINSAEAALYNLFWVHLIEGTFADQLPMDLVPDGDHKTADTIYFLLQNPGNAWWDNVSTADVIEDRDAIITRSFEDAYLEGAERLGNESKDWHWGDLHQITFRNATLGNSGIGIIENIFNRGPFAVNGSDTVIQKTCWDAREPYEVTCIPALRQVINLGDLSQSRMIHSVGQSGHPKHSFYDNFIELWRNFKYHPSNWLREDIEADRFDRLVLEPVS